MATLTHSRPGGRILPAHILKRPDLSAGCKLLLATLCDMASSRGFCWPTQRYLSESLGVCRRSIQGQLKALVERNLVQTKKGADGKTLYVLPPSLLASSSQPVGVKIAPTKTLSEAQKLRICIKDRNTSSPLPPKRSPDSASRHVGEAAPASSPQKRKECASRPTPREIEQDFAQLWSVWPIQQGKHDALHWFKRLSRAGVLPPLQVLLDTVEEFKQHDSRWRRGMVKLLSNWLRGRCWEDRPHKDTTTRANIAPEHCPPIGGAVAPKETSGQEALTAQNGPPQRLKPLPAVESATALRQLWPQQKQGEIGNLFRGLWSFLVSMRGIPPERILGKAKEYLSQTPNPDQLEYWLEKNRMSLLENAL